MINGTPVSLFDLTGQLDSAANIALNVANFSGTIFNTMPVLPGEIGVGGNIRGLGAGSERTAAMKRALLDIARMDGTAVAPVIVAGSFTVYGVNLPDALSGKPVGNAYATQQTETVQVFQSPAANVVPASSTTFDASALGTAAINADSKGYNWLVVLNGAIIPWAAAALAHTVSWSIASGIVTMRSSTAVSLTIGTTTGSATVTAASTTGVIVGMTVTGTGIPANTTVVSFVVNTSIVLSNPATATGSITGTFGFVIVGLSEVVVYKLATADVTEILAAGIHLRESTGFQSKKVLWAYFTTDQTDANRSVATIIPLVA